MITLQSHAKRPNIIPAFTDPFIGYSRSRRSAIIAEHVRLAYMPSPMPVLKAKPKLTFVDHSQSTEEIMIELVARYMHSSVCGIVIGSLVVLGFYLISLI